MKKTLILIMLIAAFTISSIPAAYAAFDANVGQTTIIQSEEYNASNGGSEIKDQMTEEERQQLNKVVSQRKKFSDLVEKKITETHDGNIEYIQTDGKWVVHNTTDEIAELIYNIIKNYEEVLGNPYIDKIKDTGSPAPSDTAINGMDIFNKFVIEHLIPHYAKPTDHINYIPSTPEAVNKWKEEIIKNIMDSLNITPHKVWIPGKGEYNTAGPSEIIKILPYLVEYYSNNDSIKVDYLKAYSCVDYETQSLWREVVEKWPGTNKTHYWEIIPQFMMDDKPVNPHQEYSNSSLAFKWQHGGKYRVTATQCVKKQYCDIMSYTMQEYIILEDAGWVIWQNATHGGQIDPSIPLGRQNNTNLYKYNSQKYPAPIFYESMCDKYVYINDYMPGGYESNVWGDKFITIRID